MPYDAPQALAFVTASATELTRTNKIEDLVTYLAGPEEEDGQPKPAAHHRYSANETELAGALRRCETGSQSRSSGGAMTRPRGVT